MNDKQLIEQGIVIYEAARRDGKSKAAAKLKAYDAIPGLKEITYFGTSGASYWARAITAVETSIRTNGNGNGHTPLPAQSAYSATEDMCAYIEKLDPQIGDEISLNLHYLAWHYSKANDGAWRYVFNPDGPLHKLGWRFAIVNSASKTYTFRVLDRPRTEEQREIARLETMMAEMQRQIALLKAK